MLVDKFLGYVMDLSPSTTSNLQQAYTLQHRKFILHESEKVFIAEWSCMGENHMHVAIYNDKMIAPIIFYMHVMWLSIIGSYNDRIYACTCMKLILW